MPELTVPGNFDAPEAGYLVVAPFDVSALRAISILQDQLLAALPKDCLWTPKNHQIHITFAHVISPDVTYGLARNTLFESLHGPVVDSLMNIVPKNWSDEVTFNEIRVFPSCIILVGTDAGDFQSMRKQFVTSVNIPSETRPVPEIIHTTIARFRTAVDIKIAQRVVDESPIHLVTKLTKLDLVHEKKIYLQEHEMLEQFPA